MASKENQKALNDIAKYTTTKLNPLIIDKDILQLQKAINDLELYKKALDKACELLKKYNCYFCPLSNEKISYENECITNGRICEKKDWKEYLLEKARKELSNGNNSL